MQTNTTPTLLQAIRQDPDTGLRWAMRDYAALVRGIARRILPGHDRDIEECTADVFVALWRNAARLEATGTPVRAWLIVTARNTSINRYRALQRRDTLPLTDELAATIADLPVGEACTGAIIYQVMKNPNLKLEEIKKLKEALVRMESVIQRDNREPWDKHDCA